MLPARVHGWEDSVETTWEYTTGTTAQEIVLYEDNIYLGNYKYDPQTRFYNNAMPNPHGQLIHDEFGPVTVQSGNMYFVNDHNWLLMEWDGASAPVTLTSGLPYYGTYTGGLSSGNIITRDIISYSGNIYTTIEDTTRLYRYDTDRWTPVANEVVAYLPYECDPTMIVHSGAIYTTISPANAVDTYLGYGTYSTNAPSGWSRIASWNGSGDWTIHDNGQDHTPGFHQAFPVIPVIQSYNDKLYSIGVHHEDAFGELHEWSGTDWVSKANNPGGETNISTMIVHSGGLYGAGVYNAGTNYYTHGHLTLWKWDDSDTWVQQGSRIQIPLSFAWEDMVSTPSGIYMGEAGHLFLWDGSSINEVGFPCDGDYPTAFYVFVTTTRWSPYNGTINCVLSASGTLYVGGRNLYKYEEGNPYWVPLACNNTIVGTSYIYNDLIIYSLVEKEGMIYAGVGGALYRYNPADYSYTLLAPSTGSQTRIDSMVVLDGNIYGATYPNGLLYMYDLATSAWIQKAGQVTLDNTVLKDMVVYEGEIYVGATNSLGPLLKWDGVSSWVIVGDTGHFIGELIVSNSELYCLTYLDLSGSVNDDYYVCRYTPPSGLVPYVHGLYYDSIEGNMVEIDGKLHVLDTSDTWAGNAPSLYRINGQDEYTKYTYDGIGTAGFTDAIYSDGEVGLIGPGVYDLDNDTFLPTRKSVYGYPNMFNYNTTLRSVVDFNGKYYMCYYGEHCIYSYDPVNDPNALRQITYPYDYVNPKYLAEYKNTLYLISDEGHMYYWDGAFKLILVTEPIASNTINAMCTFGGKLYVAGTDGQLYEYDDSTSWVSVTPKLNNVGIYSLYVWNGELYGGADHYGINRMVVYKWNGSNAWVEVATSTSTQATYSEVLSMCEFKGKLYCGSSDIGYIDPTASGITIIDDCGALSMLPIGDLMLINNGDSENIYYTDGTRVGNVRRAVDISTALGEDVPYDYLSLVHNNELKIIRQYSAGIMSTVNFLPTMNTRQGMNFTPGKSWQTMKSLNGDGRIIYSKRGEDLNITLKIPSKVDYASNTLLDIPLYFTNTSIYYNPDSTGWQPLYAIYHYNIDVPIAMGQSMYSLTIPALYTNYKWAIFAINTAGAEQSFVVYNSI
jgi:hypothetical protein